MIWPSILQWGTGLGSASTLSMTVSPGAMALMASRVHSPRARAPLAPRAASRATASRLWVWARVLFMGLVLWVGVPVAEGRRGPGARRCRRGPRAWGSSRCLALPVLRLVHRGLDIGLGLVEGGHLGVGAEGEVVGHALGRGNQHPGDLAGLGVGEHQLGPLGAPVGDDLAGGLAVFHPVDHGADHLVGGVLGSGAAAAVGHAGDAVVVGEVIDLRVAAHLLGDQVVVLLDLGVEAAGIADTVPEDYLAAAGLRSEEIAAEGQ